MRAYIVRRLLLIIPTLLLVTVIVFFTTRWIPGSTVEKMIMENLGGTGGNINVEESMEGIRHKLGLDVPVHIQYGRWITNIILHGDLGKSLWGAAVPVTKEILDRLPVSFELGFLSMMVALLIALPVGIYSAIRQDTASDYTGYWASDA